MVDIEIARIEDDRQAFCCLPDPVDYGRAAAFRAGLDSLGKEAREVVGLIFSCPAELADWTVAAADISMGSIRQYLRTGGWPHRKINRAFHQIRSMLRAI